MSSRDEAGINLRGILVESVGVQSGSQYDGSFTIGKGVTRMFDEPVLGDEYTTDRVQDLIDELDINGFTDERVVYTLKVRSISPTVAKSKARVFTRVKHPSRVGFVDVSVTGKDQSMSEDGMMNYYDVTSVVRI